MRWPFFASAPLRLRAPRVSRPPDSRGQLALRAKRQLLGFPLVRQFDNIHEAVFALIVWS